MAALEVVVVIHLAQVQALEVKAIMAVRET
jgi:hypothetical protein